MVRVRIIRLLKLKMTEVKLLVIVPNRTVWAKVSHAWDM